MSDPKIEEVEVDLAPTELEVDLADPKSEPVSVAAEAETPAPVVETPAPVAAAPEVAELRERLQAAEQVLGEVHRTAAEREHTESMAGKIFEVRQKQGELTGRIDAKQAELETAIEKGDSKASARLNREIAELAGEKSMLERDIPDPKAQSQPQARAQPPVHPKAQEWVGKNAAWFGKPNFQSESRSAVAIDNLLVAKGLDRGSPEFYAEMDKRLHVEFPHLKPAGAAPPQGGAPPRGAPPVQTPKNSGKVRLTSADLANMKRFGLDTSNPKVLREYALNKA